MCFWKYIYSQNLFPQCMGICVNGFLWPCSIYISSSNASASCQMAYSKRMSRSYRKRSYRRKPRGKYNRGRRAPFASRVKRVILKTAETKYITIGTENTQLYHDVGNFSGPTTNQGATLFDPWSFVSRGDTYKTRLADQLIPRGISIKFWMANKLDRPNVIYRIMVVVLPRTIGTTVPAYNNVDLFKPTDVGTNNTTIIAEVDRDKVKKVLYDKLVRNEAGYSAASTGTESAPGANMKGKEKHCVKKLWIKGKQQRMIKYVNGTNVHQNNYLSVYVIPYDSYGTLQTDNIASMSYFAKLYWKDP